MGSCLYQAPLVTLLEGAKGILSIPEGAKYVLFFRGNDGDGVRDEKRCFLLRYTAHVTSFGVESITSGRANRRYDAG